MTGEVHVLVDLENVQPPVAMLDTLAPGYVNAWIFHGPHQGRISSAFETAIGKRATLVPITRTGNNALDFHLSFYLGYVAARHTRAHLVVVANDTGYRPMIEHANTLGFTVRQAGYEPPKKPAAKQVPVKTAPAKKAAAKNAGVGKTRSASAAIKAVATKNGLAEPPAALRRIVKAFGKMGAERPSRKAAFLRHVANMLGRDPSEQDIAVAVGYLEQAGIVLIGGDKVTYPAKMAKAAPRSRAASAR